MPTPEAAIEYLTTTKIGEKGQLTVPKRCREDLGLGIGAPFAVLRLGDALILLPELQRFEHLCEQVTATLTAAGVRPRTILETLPQVRKRPFHRHYGTTGSVTVVSRRRCRGRRSK